MCDRLRRHRRKGAGAPPGVLVSDIGLPGEDGYAPIRKGRARASERRERVPAIALTVCARGGSPESGSRRLSGAPEQTRRPGWTDGGDRRLRRSRRKSV